MNPLAVLMAAVILITLFVGCMALLWIAGGTLLNALAGEEEKEKEPGESLSVDENPNLAEGLNHSHVPTANQTMDDRSRMHEVKTTNKRKTP